MTYDLLAATRDDVDLTTMVLALDDADPTGVRLTLRPDPHHRILTATDPDGRDVMWLGPTRPIARPAAQAHRLGLGTFANTDAHWTDICVRHLQHLALARAVADQIVAHAGGRVADLTGGIQTGGIQTGAIQTGGIQTGAIQTGAIQTGDALEPPTETTDPAPPFDAVGDTECVLVQRRPVVSLGPWVTHAVLAARAAGRILALITPPTTTLTPAVDRLVHHGALRWVVDDGVSSFEPHRHTRVDWDGARFVDLLGPGAVARAVPGSAGRVSGPDTATFTTASLPAVAAPAQNPLDHGWALQCETETLHPYDDPPVGRMASAVAFALGIADPLDAGLMEPAEAPWNLGLIARLAQGQSPAATRVIAAGDRFDGTISVLPQPGGVLERLEMLADPGGVPRTSDDLRTLGERLLDAGVQLAIVGYRRASRARLLEAATAGRPVIPALLVAHPARFPGITAGRLADAALGLDPAYPGVFTFSAPERRSPKESAATIERWYSALALLRRHDTLANRTA
ncbi:MAG: DUF6177 family protein [Dermatophilaceae bacterium]